MRIWLLVFLLGLLVGCETTHSPTPKPSYSHIPFLPCSNQVTEISCQSSPVCKYICTGGTIQRGTDVRCLKYDCIPEMCSRINGNAIDDDLEMLGTQACAAADGKNGIRACDWMLNDNDKDLCITGFAISHLNSSVCAQVANDSLRFRCLQESVIEGK
jgi:hypothetical protein